MKWKYGLFVSCGPPVVCHGFASYRVIDLRSVGGGQEFRKTSCRMSCNLAWFLGMTKGKFPMACFRQRVGESIACGSLACFVYSVEDRLSGLSWWLGFEPLPVEDKCEETLTTKAPIQTTNWREADGRGGESFKRLDRAIDHKHMWQGFHSMSMVEGVCSGSYCHTDEKQCWHQS